MSESKYGFKIVRTFTDGKNVNWQEDIIDLPPGSWQVTISPDPDIFSIQAAPREPTGTVLTFHKQGCPAENRVLTKLYAYRHEGCICE